MRNSMESARKILTAVACVALAAGCSLPRAGPYYEELVTEESKGAGEDPGFDMIEVTPTVIAATNVDESLGFDLRLVDARPERVSILGVGDLVQVTIWERGENGLFSEAGGATSLTAVIEEGGHIYLPYVGKVRASGRTVDGLRSRIRELLEEKTLDPQVEVKRETGDSKSITITGTAGPAGIIPIERTNKSLLSLLASAGFSVEDPEVVRVVVRRGPLQGEIWLSDLFSNPDYDIPVRAGDVVFLNNDTRHFRSFGAVGQARVPFPTRDISVLDAIALVGGLQATRSDPSGVFIFRKEPPEVAVQVSERATVDQPRNVAYLLDLTQNGGFFLADQMRMQDGDVLYVTDAPFARFQTIAAAIGSLIGFAGTAGGITNLATLSP
ncbi:MAG: polysaccharide biosynthesis/export family protein [Pikeienuella sp.]